MQSFNAFPSRNPLGNRIKLKMTGLCVLSPLLGAMRCFSAAGCFIILFSLLDIYRSPREREKSSKANGALPCCMNKTNHTANHTAMWLAAEPHCSCSSLCRINSVTTLLSNSHYRQRLYAFPLLARGISLFRDIQFVKQKNSLTCKILISTFVSVLYKSLSDFLLVQILWVWWDCVGS